MCAFQSCFISTIRIKKSNLAKRVFDLIDGFFTPCWQHRPYPWRELFGFYSSIAFTQNAKAHNQFVSVDTSKFKKLTDI